MTVVATDTVGDMATNSVVVTVQPPVTVTSVVPGTFAPNLGQSLTVTASVTFAGTTPDTVTLDASSINPADASVALVQQSYNAGTGVAVYTNTVTVSATESGGKKP